MSLALAWAILLLGVATIAAGLVGTGLDSWLACSAGGALVGIALAELI